MQDVFFRIGGPHVGKATTQPAVDSRPDDPRRHLGVARRPRRRRRLDVNTADTGVVVNGDDVTATGLFVEHYQRTRSYGTASGGRTVLFQNEMPYDPPNQAACRTTACSAGRRTRCADGCARHEAWGLGSYSFFNVDPTIHSSRAFEVPVRPGVRLHDILTLSITNTGTIDHVVNDFGAPTPPDTSRSTVTEYPPG